MASSMSKPSADSAIACCLRLMQTSRHCCSSGVEIVTEYRPPTAGKRPKNGTEEVKTCPDVLQSLNSACFVIWCFARGHTGHNASTASINSTQSDRSPLPARTTSSTSPPTNGSRSPPCFDVGDFGEQFIQHLPAIEQPESLLHFGHYSSHLLPPHQPPLILQPPIQRPHAEIQAVRPGNGVRFTSARVK